VAAGLTAGFGVGFTLGLTWANPAGDMTPKRKQKNKTFMNKFFIVSVALKN
jgi:hypothetical protein